MTTNKRTRWNSTIVVKENARPPKRKTAVKKRRPDRIKKRREEAFGAKAEWIRTLPCVFAVWHRPPSTETRVLCEGRVQAMHTVSRGAGGKARHLVPACAGHHNECHTQGQRTTENKYGTHLPMAAELYEALWGYRSTQPGE
jgi:hypothetical protein